MQKGFGNITVQTGAIVPITIHTKDIIKTTDKFDFKGTGFDDDQQDIKVYEVESFVLSQTDWNIKLA